MQLRKSLIRASVPNLMLALVLLQITPLGALATMTGRDKAALKMLNEQIAHKPTARAYVQRAGVYQNAEQYKQARLDMDAALKLEPKNKMFHEIRLDLCIAENNPGEEAVEVTYMMQGIPKSNKKYWDLLTRRMNLYKRAGNRKLYQKDWNEIEERRRMLEEQRKKAEEKRKKLEELRKKQLEERQKKEAAKAGQ